MRIKKFQQGGEMMSPEQQAAPAKQAGPEEQIVAMAEQIVGQLGPEAAMMLAEAIAQMVQGGGGGQPMPEEAPAYARRGGKLVPLR